MTARFDDVADELATVRGERDLDADPRVERDEPSDQPAELRAEVDRQGEPDQPVDLAGGIERECVGLLEAGERVARALEVRPAGVGQRDLARGALEQRDAELLLEAGDATADRRRR